MTDFFSLCAPSFVYLLVSAIIITIGFFNGISVATLIVKSLFVLVWAWILNYICNKGFVGVSWGLVVLPYLMILLNFLIVLETASYSKMFGAEQV